MDFEDSGIGSDPKANSEKDYATQHNEPIISFSPERCRFDSTTSSSRKSSSSFPISVEDFQLEESPPSISLLARNNYNSPSVLQTSPANITTSNCVASNATTSTKKLNEHATSQPQQQRPFANTHNSQPANFPKHSLNQAYPFLLNQQQQPNPTSSSLASLASSSIPFSTALQGPASLAISTHVLSSSTTSSTTSTAANNPKLIPTTESPSRTHANQSAPLMVNGTVLNGNTSSTSNSTTATSTSACSTTLDLQKRLEKRIAQASAIAAAAAAATSSSPSLQAATPPNPFPTATPKTKGTDSNIITNNGITNTVIPKTPSTSLGQEPTTTNPSAESKHENQISFSPQKTSLFAACQEIDFQEGTSASMPKTASSDLWEPDPLSPTSGEDFWENKVLRSGALDDFPRKSSTVESFMDGNQVHVKNETTPLPISDLLGSTTSGEPSGICGSTTVDSVAELELTCHSTATTSCKTPTTSTCTGDVNRTAGSDNNIGSINKSGATSKNNSSRPKETQNCRNNNKIKMSSNGTDDGDVTGELKPATSSFGGGNSRAATGGGSMPSPGSLASSTAVTVVNASFDIRKVSALIPPQRLAIPSKSSHSQSQSSHSMHTASKTKETGLPANTHTGSDSSGVGFSSFRSSTSNKALDTPFLSSTAFESSTSSANVHKTSTRSKLGSISESSGAPQPPSGNGSIRLGSNNASKLSTDSEKKPLVQWDSDESEEELSFFPPAKRGVITDNLSVDNMSLSGEEEDLHLTPPRPLSKKCPCDPRSWLDRRDISSNHHHHADTPRSISSQYSCIVS